MRTQANRRHTTTSDPWRHRRARDLLGPRKRRLLQLFTAWALLASSLLLYAAPATAAVPVAQDDAYTIDEGATLDADWWHPDWTRRRSIVFDNSAQASSLTRFPVLVELPATFDYGNTQDAGQDVRFFDPDGTALAFEIEQWDEGGVSAVWVNVPRIDAGSTTDSIVMYYGNSTVGDGQDPALVWNNDYRMVYHLETLTESSGTFGPATSTGGSAGAAIVAGGRTFSGNGQHLDLGTNLAVLNAVGAATISAWIRFDSLPGTTEVFGVTRGGSNTNSRINLGSRGSEVGIIARSVDANSGENGDKEFVTTSGPLTAAAWYHVAAVVDYANDDVRIYVNGTAQPVQGIPSGVIDFANTATPGTNSNQAKIGSDEAGVAGQLLGSVDEARLMRGTRSNDWIRAEYLSMTGGLASLGAVQVGPTTVGALGNDTDADGDEPAATLLTGPSQAAGFAFRADGTFTYTPASGWSGIDTFTYGASDGNGGTDNATVTVTVNDVNVAPVLGAIGDQTVDELGVLSFTATATDADVPVQALSFDLSGAPSGAVVDAASGVFSWTPSEAQDGTHTFDVVVMDDGVPSLSDAESITVTVNEVVVIPFDLTPVAVADGYTAYPNATATYAAPGVLGNDFDPDGSPLVAILREGPDHGTVTLRPDGSFTYRHESGGHEPDSFRYVASDGFRRSSPVTVSIELVNRAPVATADVVSLEEDTSTTFLVLGNDSDPDGDALRLLTVESPAHGAMTRTGNLVTYQPAENWHGAETLAYTVTDDWGGVDAAAVTVTVNAVNDVPTARDLRVSVDGGVPFAVDLNTVTSDPDGDTLVWELSVAGHGVVNALGRGRFEYEGKIGYTGPDSFRYTVRDPSGASASGVVSLSVAGVPAENVGIRPLVGFEDTPPPGGAPAAPAQPDGGDGGSLIPFIPGMRLVIGSVFDTFTAIRVPFLFLLVAFALSMLLGFSRRFLLPNGPVFLPVTAPDDHAVVLIPDDADLPARVEPGGRHDIVYRFAPAERDLRSTGRRAQVGSKMWAKVETPQGDAWVPADRLTPQLTAASFAKDRQVRDLADRLAALFAVRGNLRLATSDAGLWVASPTGLEYFAPGDLRDLLEWNVHGGGTVVGEIVASLRESIAETVPEPDGRSDLPVELANFHHLSYHDATDGHDRSVLFQFVDGTPTVIALHTTRPLGPEPWLTERVSSVTRI